MLRGWLSEFSDVGECHANLKLFATNEAVRYSAGKANNASTSTSEIPSLASSSRNEYVIDMNVTIPAHCRILVDKESLAMPSQRHPVFKTPNIHPLTIDNCNESAKEVSIAIPSQCTQQIARNLDGIERPIFSRSMACCCVSIVRSKAVSRCSISFTIGCH